MKLEISAKKALKKGEKQLELVGIADSKSSAEYLLCEVLGVNKTGLIVDSDRALTIKELADYQRYINRRAKNEPVSQIVGSIDFCGRNIKVNSDVLTPRPETELLIDAVLREISNKNSSLKILDIGTGSGAIALVMAEECPKADVFASDISPKALALAKDNAKKLNLEERIIFKKGDLFEPWGGYKFDVIIANLPYIPEDRKGSLDKNVVDFEPEEALFSGVDGLDAYRDFFRNAPDYLSKNGSVMIEIDETQAVAVENLAKKHLSGCKLRIIKDLAGFDRIAIINMEFNKEEK